MPDRQQEQTHVPDSFERPVRSRGGRPKLDADVVRGSTIGVRVSAPEYAVLADKAAAMGVTPATWLRLAALSRRLPVRPMASDRGLAIGAIGRLGSNLNQLAKAAHMGRATVDEELLLAVLEEVRALHAALIGRSR